MAMGGQASLLDGPHKGTGPNKRNVTGSALDVINNKSQLSKTDLASKDGRRGDLGVEGEQPPICVNHSLPSGLLLLREAINLSGNRVTHAQTKEHFGDVQQVLRQMTLIRLLLTRNPSREEQSSLGVQECPSVLTVASHTLVSWFCLSFLFFYVVNISRQPWEFIYFIFF